jgi:uncharacterized protein
MSGIYRPKPRPIMRNALAIFGGLPLKLDIRNEARVHLWYKDRFGYAIKPYSSSAEAIATFPTTATSVGIRRVFGKFECCAPYGLDDLFGLVVTPNKRQITRAIYEAKIDRWRSTWPDLTYLAWERRDPGNIIECRAAVQPSVVRG